MIYVSKTSPDLLVKVHQVSENIYGTVYCHLELVQEYNVGGSVYRKGYRYQNDKLTFENRYDAIEVLN